MASRLVLGLSIALVFFAALGLVATPDGVSSPTVPSASSEGAVNPAADEGSAVATPADPPEAETTGQAKGEHAKPATDQWSTLFVFALATFIGIGVIARVSRLLHTPLMSLTNAISAIAVVGSIIVTGGEEYPTNIRILGAIALFCSMTNIVSGFLITDRMLKMFKTPREEVKK